MGENRARHGRETPRRSHLLTGLAALLRSGSHIDPTLVPEVDSDAEGTPTALESFVTRKQDVVVWDQRCW